MRLTNLLLTLVTLFISNSIWSAEFYVNDGPSDFNLETPPFIEQRLKNGTKIWGYLHEHKVNGNRYLRLKFSDGSGGDHTVAATLACTEDGKITGYKHVIDHMGPSLKTMVHRYTFKTDCTGDVGVHWHKVKTKFDPNELMKKIEQLGKEEIIKLALAYVSGT
ncbi:hypothetical protein [Pleionea sediminis]|uniref:hypothetical protein n=1 Tax=Pleionea sediminis TaxID=2569479 RepID=UPI001184F63F|nr:hypothetical protein [Pleionea sediminis]